MANLRSTGLLINSLTYVSNRNADAFDRQRKCLIEIRNISTITYLTQNCRFYYEIEVSHGQLTINRLANSIH